MVDHEAGHIAILRRCGTMAPPIMGNRVEEVTDAYAELFIGRPHRPPTDADREIARQIRAGRCY